MSYPHRIRLRGPWEAEPLDPPGEPRRISLPGRPGGCGLAGCRRVLFRRRFGRPRRIDDYEQVWLVGERFTGTGRFVLNGRDVGSAGGDAESFAFPVTALVADRNELTIDFSAGETDDEPWSDIALEIRCAAYLNDLRAEPAGDGRLLVSGAVEGEPVGPLDVYVLSADRTVGYQQCHAGERFQVVTDPLPAGTAEVRVELVRGSVVWFASLIPRA